MSDMKKDEQKLSENIDEMTDGRTKGNLSEKRNTDKSSGRSRNITLAVCIICYSALYIGVLSADYFPDFFMLYNIPVKLFSVISAN